MLLSSSVAIKSLAEVIATHFDLVEEEVEREIKSKVKSITKAKEQPKAETEAFSH